MALALEWAKAIADDDDDGLEIPECNCHMRESLGLLCWHDMLERIESGEGLPLAIEDIHQHWLLKDPRDLQKLASERAKDDMRMCGRGTVSEGDGESATNMPSRKSSARTSVKREGKPLFSTGGERSKTDPSVLFLPWIDTPMVSVTPDVIEISSSDDRPQRPTGASSRDGPAKCVRPSDTGDAAVNGKRRRRAEVRRVEGAVADSHQLLAEETESEDEATRINLMLRAPVAQQPKMSGVPLPFGVESTKTLTQEDLEDCDGYESPGYTRTSRTEKKIKGGVQKRVGMRHLPTNAERIDARVEAQQVLQTDAMAKRQRKAIAGLQTVWNTNRPSKRPTAVPKNKKNANKQNTVTHREPSLIDDMTTSPPILRPQNPTSTLAVEPMPSVFAVSATAPSYHGGQTPQGTTRPPVAMYQALAFCASPGPSMYAFPSTQYPPAAAYGQHPQHLAFHDTSYPLPSTSGPNHHANGLQPPQQRDPGVSRLTGWQP